MNGSTLFQNFKTSSFLFTAFTGDSKKKNLEKGKRIKDCNNFSTAYNRKLDLETIIPLLYSFTLEV